MPLLTLTTYWSTELASLDAALTAIRAELATAQTEARNAAIDAAAASAQIRATQEAVEAARRQLSGIPLPADGNPLLEAMRDAIKAWRQASADQVALAASAQQAEARRAALQARVDALAVAHAEALLAQAQEIKASAQRAQWATIATTAPVSELPAAANTAWNANKGPATTVVEGDFPTNKSVDEKSFLDRARDSRALAQTAVDGVAGVATASLAEYTTWSEASTRQQDKLAKKQRAFFDAVEKLRRFAESAPRVDQAVADLAALSTATSILSAAERAELITTTAALRTKRQNALQLLVKRDTKQQDLLTVQAAYAKALYLARVAAPDKTEAELLTADPGGLQVKFDAIGTANTAVQTADGLLGDDSKTSDRTALKTWFAAVPEALWERLDKLDASLDVLKATKSIVPGTLVSDVLTAEDDLVKALAAARLEARQIVARQQGVAADQQAAADAATLVGRRRQVAQRYLALI